jgi:hypothetical protein
MKTPETPFIDPLHAIRGAAADVVLRDCKLPDVPFDRRNPQAYATAVQAHLETVVRPRVAAWIRECLPDDTVRAAHGLVGRYNEVIRLHPGERIHAADFMLSRPPMDPFEAMAHQVDIDPAAKRAAQLCDTAAIAEHGPAASLDYARMCYVQMLRETRMALAQMYVPSDDRWRESEDRRHWQRAGQSHLLVLPLVYRNAEEYLAGHMVAGTVPDLATPPFPVAPGIPEDNAAWKESVNEHRRYAGIITTLQRRAERVLDEYREYLRVDAGRGALGRLIASVGNWFPADDCQRLTTMLRKEQRLQKARELADDLHATWQRALEMGAAPVAGQVGESYKTVHRALREFADLVDMLVDRVLGGYEGK